MPLNQKNPDLDLRTGPNLQVGHEPGFDPGVEHKPGAGAEPEPAVEPEPGAESEPDEDLN